MGAVLVVGDMAAERERVQELVDLVPAKHLEAAARMMRGLLEEPVLAAFAYAPVDDEGELSDEAIADVAFIVANALGPRQNSALRSENTLQRVVRTPGVGRR